jgi:hypothetical protein
MKYKPSILVFLSFFGAAPLYGQAPAGDGWVSLFNGRDLTHWVAPEGDNGHWKVVDGVIDYDALSEAEGDKNLWSVEEYGDFQLALEWRIKGASRNKLRIWTDRQDMLFFQENPSCQEPCPRSINVRARPAKMKPLMDPSARPRSGPSITRSMCS